MTWDKTNRMNFFVNEIQRYGLSSCRSHVRESTCENFVSVWYYDTRDHPLQLLENLGGTAFDVGMGEAMGYREPYGGEKGAAVVDLL
jgi:hypothetical protein